MIPKIHIKRSIAIHVYVYSCMYTYLLTTQRTQYYTLGSNNRLFVSIFHCYFTFIYLFYKCMSKRVLLCVWKMENNLWVPCPASILLVLRIKLWSSDLAENAFNLLSWFSLLSQILISNTNPSKGNHVFSVLFKSHRMEMVGFQSRGRVIRN